MLLLQLMHYSFFSFTHRETGNGKPGQDPISWSQETRHCLLRLGNRIESVPNFALRDIKGEGIFAVTC